MGAPEDSIQFVSRQWFVVNDDVVGGYAISSIDKPLSKHDYTKGERHWVECASKYVADYIVELHNKTLP